MRINISFLLVIVLFLFSSCNTSKKLLVNEIELLRKENISLVKENDNLNNKLILLVDAFDELSNENAQPINIKPTIDLEIISTNSELSELESFLKTDSQLGKLESYLKSDAVLNSNFRTFKNGGIEKDLNVSYSIMQRVIATAKTYLGTSYLFGGTNKSGIDCSGLLYVSFKANGITNIPRLAQEFARFGSIVINTNDIKAGDLIFFTNTYKTSKLVTHAGLCIGNGEFIHTSSSKGVMISRVNDPYYWRKKFLFATRVIN